jgi:hypothetical protein
LDQRPSALRLITDVEPDQEVAMAKMCKAGVPEASAPPGGRVTEARVLPALSATVSEKMLPVPE